MHSERGLSNWYYNTLTVRGRRVVAAAAAAGVLAASSGVAIWAAGEAASNSRQLQAGCTVELDRNQTAFDIASIIAAKSGQLGANVFADLQRTAGNQGMGESNTVNVPENPAADCRTQGLDYLDSK